MWFTAEQGLDGPVYGAADQWNGIGVFFDSFDNDGKVGFKSESELEKTLLAVVTENCLCRGPYKTRETLISVKKKKTTHKYRILNPV